MPELSKAQKRKLRVLRIRRAKGTLSEKDYRKSVWQINRNAILSKEITKERQEPEELTSIEEGGRVYTGKVVGQQFIGVRTVGEQEQELRKQRLENVRRGFYSIKQPEDMGVGEFKARENVASSRERAELVSEQVVLKRTLPSSTAVIKREEVSPYEVKKVFRGVSDGRGENGVLDREVSGGDNVGVDNRGRIQVLEKVGKGIKTGYEETLIEYPKSVGIGVGKILYDPFSTGKKPLVDFTIEGQRGNVSETQLAYGQPNIAPELKYSEFAEKTFRVRGGREALLFDPDVQTVAMTGGVILLGTTNLGAKIVSGGLTVSNIGSFLKAPSAESFGKTIAVQSLISAPEILKAKSYFSKTELELQAYPTEKKITFVGEGKIKGEPVSAVIVSDELGSKLFLRQGKKLNIKESGEFVPDVLKKKLPVERTIKSEIIQGGVDAYIDELQVIKLSSKKPGQELNLEINELRRRNIQVSPQITKKTEITPEGLAEIKSFEVIPPELKFGKGDKLIDELSIKDIPSGIEIIEVKQPYVRESGIYKRGGKGSLKIKYPSQFNIDVRNLKQKTIALGRSRKGMMAPLETIPEKPKVYIEGKGFKPVKLSIPELPELVGETYPKVFGIPKLSSEQTNIKEILQKPKPSVKEISKTDIFQDLKPSVYIRSTSGQKSIAASLIISKQKQKPSFQPLMRYVPNIYTPEIPVSSIPIPEQPVLPVLPFGFDLPFPKIYFSKEKGGRRKSKGQKFSYVPSLVGVELGIKARRKKGYFTGLELRGV